MTNTINNFDTPTNAFHSLYWRIVRDGVDFANTKALFNVGFEIQFPQHNEIHNNKVERNWSKEYAEAEWQWYLSGDPSISKLGEIYGKIPGIWELMADKYGHVNSNYGYQWKRFNQLDKVIEKLKTNKNTRQAAISIYDGKEQDSYATDTPCTYAVQFTILNNRLNMSVVMRSNDLWYGFCNDQYQFSSLQMLVAKELDIQVGTYYHFAHNLHLYNDKLPKLTTRNYHL
jgi:thymidylate synthase